ncbi:MAG: peptidylprolyl isomerase [Oscillospiraceae bacterium]|jgi:hypothetical protein|nr:peptidylprolyl isomerase [Oscillospiraceae bacterium]
MKKNDVQNQAELYRQERKERLAKTARKTAKRSPEAIKRLLVVRKIFASVVAALLCLVLIYGAMTFFGVPQKVLTAVTVGDKRVTVAEYNFYYATAFSNVYQTAQQYEQYGAGYGKMLTGYDYSLAPDKQTTENEAGETIPYTQKLRETTLDNIAYENYYYNKAVEAGMTLTEEQEKEIDDNIEEYRAAAKEQHYSLNRFLNRFYKGVNEKMFKRLLTRQQLAASYLEKAQEDKAASITDAEVDAVYDEDPTAYNNVNIRLFGIAIEAEDTTDDTEADTETTTEGDAQPTKEELKAKEMMGKVKSEESFVALAKEYADEDDKETFEKDEATLFRYRDFETVKSATDEDTAKWVFDSARKKGDMTVATTAEYVYVIYVIDPAYKVEYAPVTVRHSLVQFAEEKDTNGNVIELTAEKKAEYLTKAENLLAEWKAGEATEESFAVMANENSDDKASTVGTSNEYESAPKGGLYENVEKGTMVAAFEDWIFDPARKTGDTGIVETTYGYHIMYFVKTADEPQWRTDIKATISDDYMKAQDEEAKADYDNTAKESIFTNWAMNKVVKQINSLYFSALNSKQQTAQ